jgi:succinate dehydrogenase/fumarate reductase cytochrome b subunit
MALAILSFLVSICGFVTLIFFPIIGLYLLAVIIVLSTSCHRVSKAAHYTAAVAAVLSSLYDFFIARVFLFAPTLD